MILISIESVLVVFVFLQHAVILQKVMIDKKRELERLETNKVSIQELWFLTRVTILDWSNTVSVIWLWCECTVGGLLVSWFLSGGLICVWTVESLDVVMYTLSIQQTHTRCCHIHVHLVYSTNPNLMLLYRCTCSLFNKPIFDVVKLLISIVFSYVLLLDFVCRNDSHILLGFPKINV